MDPTYRLRTATRLHFLLLRRYGQHIDVGLLLKCETGDHDGLWLCKATGDAELIALGRLLAHANRSHARQEARLRALDVPTPPKTRAAATGRAEQPMPWGRATTGFGLTAPQDLAGLPTSDALRAGSRWINPLTWLKPGASQQAA